MGLGSFTNYNKIYDFVMSHYDDFTDLERKILFDYARHGLFKGKMVPDLVREVFDELRLLDDDNNIYLGFMDLLESEFPVEDKNILEVGGGIIPSLAKRISSKQTTGKITVYDPRLSSFEEDTDKLTLVRKKFDVSTDLGDTNLMIAFMPCEAAFRVVESATKNNVDFMLALCEGGPHGDIFDFFEDEDEWLNAVIYTAENSIERSNMGTLGKTYLKKYHDPYPVIYNKRR